MSFASGASTQGASGNVQIVSADGAGTGRSGDVTLQTGVSATGGSGSISLSTGSSSAGGGGSIALSVGATDAVCCAATDTGHFLVSQNYSIWILRSTVWLFHVTV